MNIIHDSVNVLKVVDSNKVLGYNLTQKTYGEYEVHFKNNKYGYKLLTGVKIKLDGSVIYVRNAEYSIEFERGRNRSIAGVRCKMYNCKTRYTCHIDHDVSTVKITKNKKTIFNYDSNGVTSNVAGVILDTNRLNSSYSMATDLYTYRLPISYTKLYMYNIILINDTYEEYHKILVKLLKEEREKERSIADRPNTDVKHIDAVCAICKEKNPTYAMKECMHLCLCDTCEVNIESCPMCRVVGVKAKVYY